MKKTLLLVFFPFFIILINENNVYAVKLNIGFEQYGISYWKEGEFYRLALVTQCENGVNSGKTETNNSYDAYKELCGIDDPKYVNRGGNNLNFEIEIEPYYFFESNYFYSLLFKFNQKDHAKIIHYPDYNESSEIKLEYNSIINALGYLWGNQELGRNDKWSLSLSFLLYYDFYHKYALKHDNKWVNKPKSDYQYGLRISWDWSNFNLSYNEKLKRITNRFPEFRNSDGYIPSIGYQVQSLSVNYSYYF